VEAAIGNPANLLQTAMGTAMEQIKKAAFGKGNTDAC
jgi:hypothetical protein